MATETARPFHLAAGEGEPMSWFTARFRLKASTPDIGFCELEVPPGVEPPMHVHAHEDEGYYLLDGEATFHVGGEDYDGRAGSFVFFPRHVPHTFTVRGDSARMLLLNAPGGFERMFELAPSTPEEAPRSRATTSRSLGRTRAKRRRQRLGWGEPPPCRPSHRRRGRERSMPEPVVTEIAPDVYRVSVFVPEINLQFNHFVVDDEQPLLFHTGLKDMFPLVVAGVARVVDPGRIRWISFSHTESDECGAMGEWLQAAPNATPVCSQVGALVNRDFVSAVREARGMADGETLETGKYRFRFLRTAQLPHGWDAGLLYEETQRTLLCSDLFHQNGECEPLTESDVVERARNSLREYEAGILADYVPYSPRTDRAMQRLAELQPRTLAIMHGSTYVGDGERALQELNGVLREIFGEP